MLRHSLDLASTDVPDPSASVIALSLSAAKAVEVILTGAAFDPVYSSRTYDVRSLIDGAIPESIQVTVKAVPPGYSSPAPGVWKITSPKVKGADMKRDDNNIILSRILLTCKS